MWQRMREQGRRDMAQSASSLPYLINLAAFFFVRQAYAAHRWTTPGGRVEDGESPLMALEREVLEEIGCEVQVAHLIGVYAKMTCVSTESKREQD
jgi:8-oxo-dGTP pyrophosphatase MutT (NUDIX family)